MSYTINLSSGAPLIPTGLADGTVDNSHTSLKLIGKSYAGYGQFLNENFVHLLENFSNLTAPSNPLTGQLWWDTTNNIMKVYSGTSWKIATGATSSATPPGDLSALGGDLWFDSVNQQLKVYNGSSTWVTIGPPSINQSIPSNYTGAAPTTIQDTSGSAQPIIGFFVTGTIYAIVSKNTFSTTIPGFATVKQGLNFNLNYASIGLNTQDTNATNNTLVQRTGTGGVNATTGSFSGAVSAGSFTTAGTVTATGGLNGSLTGNVNASTINASTISTQGINASSGYTGTMLTASQPNITTLGNVTNLQLNGTATLNGVPLATQGGSASFTSINNTPIGTITPSSGAFTSVSVANGLAPIPAANATLNLGTPTAWWNNLYVNNIVTQGQGAGGLTVSGSLVVIGGISASGSIVPSGNLQYNLGSTTSWWNNIYGTAIHAQYADLAERFEADAEYEPGTVVEIGGAAEITAVGEDLSDNVFGVISTKAAYLMNSGAGTDKTHPPIAVQGRVPVRVVGKIRKGDRLVSAGNGFARAGTKTEISAWNVIGRALENKTDSGEGVIEAVVKLNS